MKPSGKWVHGVFAFVALLVLISCKGVGPDSSATQPSQPSQPSEPGSFMLTVKASGSGTVTSSPSGIQCGSDCSHSFNANSKVTLTAMPASGYDFAGWGSPCSGTGSCTLTLSAAQNVSATFSAVPLYQASVTDSGTGSGTVTSSPAGLNCRSNLQRKVSRGDHGHASREPCTEFRV